MYILALKLLIGILLNTQLLFGEQFAHLSYLPKQKEIRANQHEIDAFRHELMQYHALNKFAADSNREEVAYKLIEELAGGSQALEVTLKGALEPVKKTMFSQNLELIDVFEKFREGCCNNIKWSISPTSGAISVLVKTKQGMEIQAFFNKFGILETMFPFFNFGKICNSI